MEDAECRIGQKHLKRVGILGGSFDPIHKGHLNIAQSAYEEFALDEVWFIPAGHSPNKDEKKMTAADIRAEMTALAIYDIPYFKLSRMEIDAEGTSYTYLTLTKLKEACIILKLSVRRQLFWPQYVMIWICRRLRKRFLP